MSSTTTRNRLQELRSSAGIKQGDAATDPAANLPWNRPGGGHDTKQNAAQRTSRIRIVLADIDRDITDYLDDLTTISSNVLVLASEMRRAIGQSEEARILDEMEQALEQSKLYNAKVKGCLDDLEGVQSKKGNALTKAEKDYCKSIIRDKSARFQEEIKALLSAQAAFENEQKLKVRKQMTVLYPEATAEELRVIEEDPDAMKKLMQEKIKRGSKQSQASGNAEEEASLREQIEQLQSQQDAMVRLEESVVELSELFFYLNTLMEQQAKTVESIEESVNHTVEYTGKAVEKLEEAEHSKASYDAKRKGLMGMWYTLIIVGIIAGCGLLFMFVIKPCLDMKDAVTPSKSKDSSASSAASSSSSSSASASSSFVQQKRTRGVQNSFEEVLDLDVGGSPGGLLAEMSEAADGKAADGLKSEKGKKRKGMRNAALMAKKIAGMKIGIGVAKKEDP